MRRLRFGEVPWWFFPNAAEMAFYDATTARLLIRPRPPLHLFLTPNDDPALNGHDAGFLCRSSATVAAIRSGIRTTHRNARFEW